MRDTAEARRLPVEGARNLRDLGGYRTADGRIVQPRKILRGGHPGQMTQAGRAAFARLGLRTIVDLRSTSERETLPFPDDVLASARYWSRGYDLSRGDIVQILRDPATSPDLMRQRMISNYAILPYEQGPGIAAALRLLAEGEVPLLVNCTAGKDRTGIACAVILAALGVPREQVVDGQTGFLVPAQNVPDLAMALRRLAEDAALRARMGAAGRARALDLYDEGRVVARTLDLLGL